MIQKIRAVLSVILLLVLIGLVIEATRFFYESRMTVVASRSAFKEEVGGLRKDVVGEISSTRKSLFQKVDRLQDQVDHITLKAESDIVAVLERRGLVIDTQLTRIGDSSVVLMADADKAVLHADAVMDDVQETSELLLECDGNPNCLANRVIGTMQAIEGFSDAGRDAMKEVKAATPELLADAQRVSDEVVVMAQKGAEASGESVAVMKNIRKQTEPLPLALRVAGKFALPAIGYITGVFLK